MTCFHIWYCTRGCELSIKKQFLLPSWSGLLCSQPCIRNTHMKRPWLLEFLPKMQFWTFSRFSAWAKLSWSTQKRHLHGSRPFFPPAPHFTKFMHGHKQQSRFSNLNTDDANFGQRWWRQKRNKGLCWSRPVTTCTGVNGFKILLKHLKLPYWKL